jgi:DNA-binding IscR family transcriptional regulator
MKITSQEEYGLRCLMRLARAEDGRSLTIPEIAADEGLSFPYVAKLLAVLRQAGQQIAEFLGVPLIDQIADGD